MTGDTTLDEPVRRSDESAIEHRMRDLDLNFPDERKDAEPATSFQAELKTLQGKFKLVLYNKPLISSILLAATPLMQTVSFLVTVFLLLCFLYRTVSFL